MASWHKIESRFENQPRRVLSSVSVESRLLLVLSYSGPLWRGARQSLEEMLTTAMEMALQEHSDYFIVDDRTGEQIRVP
jgi:hypothetical protein